VENQINSPSLCSLSPAMAQARYRRERHRMSLRASLAIIYLWRKFLAVFIGLAYVVEHEDRNSWGFFCLQMISVLCVNVYPAKPPVPVLPWGNESRRVITRCRTERGCLCYLSLPSSKLFPALYSLFLRKSMLC